MRRTLASVLVAAALAGGSASARSVDVGGYKLRVLTRGQGPPTVVFDAGLGLGLETWDEIWPHVRKRAKVCLYDRAGLGRSDPGPLPRTSDRMVDELHTLLGQARIDPPYILVGHSLGALNMRLFASRYPDEVAGLLLIDPTPEDFPARDRQMRSEESRVRIETLQSLGPAAAREELRAAEASAEQVRAARLPDQVPVIVVSSTRPEESAAFRQVWSSMQDELAGRLGARHVIADASGHYIQYDEPELVVEAVLQLIDAFNRPRSRPPAARPEPGSGRDRP